jgi:hypothetical protein
MFFTAVCLSLPVEAGAQLSPPPETSRVTIAGGLGAVDPFHGDLTFVAPAWEASVRVRVGAIAALEVGAARWWHNEEDVRTDQPILGSAGPIGTIDRIEQRTTYSHTTVELNLLATGGIGRVTMWGGGGVGWLNQSRAFRQTVSGCHLTVPVACEDFETTHTFGDAQFQGAGGVDVRIGGLVAAYGAVRLAIPTRDVGSSELRFVGGIRIGL